LGGLAVLLAIAGACVHSEGSKGASTGTEASGGPPTTAAPEPTTTLDPFTAEQIAQQRATEPGFFQIMLPATSVRAAKKYEIAASVYPANAPTSPSQTGITLPPLPTEISTTMAVVLDATDSKVTPNNDGNIDAAKQALLLIGNEHTTWQWTVEANEPPLGQTSYTMHLTFHEYFFVHPDDAQGVEVTPSPARDVQVTINGGDVVKHGFSTLWKAIVAVATVLAGLGVFLGARRARKGKKHSDPTGTPGKEIHKQPTLSPHGSSVSTTNRTHRRRHVKPKA
jgi:hypothetical protein